MAKINKDSLRIGVTFTECKKCERVEVMHGRWERFEEISGNIGVSCSVCGWKDYHHGRYKGNLFTYCPKCGAKMDGGDNNGIG